MSEILFVLLFFVIVMYLWHRIGYYFDKRAWNNAVCPKCEKGFWKSFDMDSSGAVGYSCTNCDNSIWINGHFNPHKKGPLTQPVRVGRS